jgi:hypothetical protein
MDKHECFSCQLRAGIANIILNLRNWMAPGCQLHVPDIGWDGLTENEKGEKSSTRRARASGEQVGDVGP